MIEHRVEQGSEEWHKLRAGVVTASEFNRIITPGKLKLSEARHEYMAAKLMEWIWGQPLLESEETKWMHAGTDQQDSAMRAYEFETGQETKCAGFFTTDDGLVGASPDGLVAPNALLEIKGRKPVLHLMSLLGQEQFSMCHRIQVQGQLLVCEDRDRDDLYCYALAKSPIPNFVIQHYRDKSAQAAIKEAIDQFCTEMLEKREWLYREFGPFELSNRVGQTAATDYLGVSDEDVDAILAARF